MQVARNKLIKEKLRTHQTKDMSLSTFQIAKEIIMLKEHYYKMHPSSLWVSLDFE
jgi:hypothetical protein